MESLELKSVLESDGGIGANRLLSNKNKGLWLAGLTGGVGIGLSLICLPFVAPAFRKICLPYVPATDLQVSNVLKVLKGRTGTLVDIGSGDGRIVIAAAKCGFRSDGVELNPWLVHYSRISALFNNVNKQTRFYRKNLWKFNLKPYNNIVIFGVEEMMGELEEKIRKEVEAGSVVVACRFPLVTMEPREIVGDGVDTIWKYHL